MAILFSIYLRLIYWRTLSLSAIDTVEVATKTTSHMIEVKLSKKCWISQVKKATMNSVIYKYYENGLSYN